MKRKQKKLSTKVKKSVAITPTGDLKALYWSLAYGIVIALLALPCLTTIASVFVFMFVLMFVTGGIFTAFAFSDFENF
jgi:hypothetical protein